MAEIRIMTRRPTVRRNGELVPVRLLEDKVFFDSHLAEYHPRRETREGFKIVDASIEDAYFGKTRFTDGKGEVIFGLRIDVNYGDYTVNGNLLYLDMKDIGGLMHLLRADRTEWLKDKKVLVYKDVLGSTAAGISAVALAVEDTWTL